MFKRCYALCHVAGGTPAIETVQDGFVELKALLHYGAPLYASVLLTGLIPLFQSIVLAAFTTDADIGNYRAATNFITLVTLITIPITTALLPAFSRLDSSSSGRIKLFFKLANKYTAAIVLVMTFLILLLSNQIVEAVYGVTYESAALYLATHVLLYC